MWVIPPASWSWPQEPQRSGASSVHVRDCEGKDNIFLSKIWENYFLETWLNKNWADSYFVETWLNKNWADSYFLDICHMVLVSTIEYGKNIRNILKLRLFLDNWGGLDNWKMLNIGIFPNKSDVSLKFRFCKCFICFFVLALELCTRRRELADGKVGTPTYASWQYKHWFPSIFTSSNQR